MKFDKEKLVNEIDFSATASSGPGGQHANRAYTKVLLEWDLKKTEVFEEKTLDRLRKKLGNYINQQDVLQLSCDQTRNQYRNKMLAISRFLQLIRKGLHQPKPRVKPKPGKKFHQKRLEEKKRQAQKKQQRKNPLH